MKTVELKDLVGKHKLSGVDFELGSFSPIKGDYDGSCIRFCLDNIIYIALEDPSDGYRSSMGECYVVEKGNITNKFQPIDVYCVMKPSGYYNNDILQVYDTLTNKIVMEVGTEDYDDYYPSFVSSWNPANMCLNQ